LSYLVLARKWRPKLFDEVVGQDHAVKALKNSLIEKKIHQAYIFNGTRGVGKTSIARILTKAFNCENLIDGEPCNTCSSCNAINNNSSIDFQEIDAASRRSRDETMSLLETVPYMPATSKYKVYLIDEVHMLTKESFNALLKTLEEPPPHVIFMFATTEIEKVPPTILSRCLQLNLKSVLGKDISNQLIKIFKEEKVLYDDGSIELIADAAKGSIRDALTISEKVISYCGGNLEKKSVQDILGIPDDESIFKILNILKDKDANALVKFLDQFDQDQSCERILETLLTLVQKVSVYQFSDKNDSLLEQFSDISPEYLQLIYQIGIDNKKYFKSTADALGLLSMTLIKMIAFSEVEKKNFSLSAKQLNSLGTDLEFIWSEVFTKMEVSNLLKQILFYSSAKKDNEDIVISLPKDKLTRLSDNYKEEIRVSLNEFFRSNMSISYDSNLDKTLSPHFIDQEQKNKESDEAKNSLSNDLGFKKISKEIEINLKNINKK
jgi:DNA polymerase-3 subunit gamma/tau